MKLVRLLIPLAILLVGCRESNRTIELPDNILTVGKLRQLQPHDCLPFAFDTKGERMATMRESAKELIEIRSVDTGEILDSLLAEESFPIMFSHDTSALYCVSARGIEELDLATRKKRLLVEDYYYIPIGRNALQSVTVLATPEEDFLAINNRGGFFRSTKQPLFDQFGNAWAESEGKWKMLGTSALTDVSGTKPSYLVKDQSAVRGGMQLVTIQRTETRKGAEAFTSTIWLDHVQAQGKARSALVFAGADVYVAGFVPNRNLVCVFTSQGGYLLPIDSKPKEK